MLNHHMQVQAKPAKEPEGRCGAVVATLTTIGLLGLCVATCACILNAVKKREEYRGILIKEADYNGDGKVSNEEKQRFDDRYGRGIHWIEGRPYSPQGNLLDRDVVIAIVLENYHNRREQSHPPSSSPAPEVNTNNLAPSSLEQKVEQ